MSMLDRLRIVLQRIFQKLPVVSGARKIESAERINTLRVRESLDLLEFRHRFDKENHYFVGELDADEDFPENITVLILPEPNRITTKCFVPNSEIENVKLKDALLFCNRWNSEKLYPKAFIEPSYNLIIAESTMMVDDTSPDEFIREAVLHNTLSAAWQFFVEMNRRQIGQNGKIN